MPTWLRLARIIAVLSIGLSFWVFAIRALSAYEASEIPPGVAVTSGCEEESLNTVWRAIHGGQTYSESTSVPYSAAYFNWLFYATYKLPVAAAVGRFGSIIMPNTGRVITAVFALLGTAVLAWCLNRVMSGDLALSAGLAGTAFFGPLVGWWAITLRPDVGALALETFALSIVLLGYRRTIPSIPLALGLFYAAWSFKQTYVMGLGGAVLFLVVRQCWRAAATLALGAVGLWCLTLLALGTNYISAQLNTATTNVYYLGAGLANLRGALERTAPLWLLAAPSLCWHSQIVAEPDSTLAADARLLGFLGLLVSLPLAFAASCKIGAALNYYFTPSLFLAFLAASALATRPAPRLATIAFLSASALQLLLALGFTGSVSLASQSRDLAQKWHAWREAPTPRFSALNTLNLPWLNPGQPAFVLAYNYPLERAAGRAFERGGIGGLISDGYFASLLLPESTTRVYDGGALVRYSRGPAMQGYVIFYRTDSPEP